jgi:IS605 OrfB family transposase
MQLRFNYRLYPGPGQRQALARSFGCARVVFNDTVAARRAAWADGGRRVTDAQASKLLTESKRTPERAWLSDASAVVLQQAVADANTAHRNWMSSISGKRRGKKLGAPRFRSRKDSRQAIRFTRNACFKVTTGGKLRLPKIGDVPVRWSRELPSDPSSVTVVLDAAGRYFASFVVDVEPSVMPSTDSEIGIDLGLTHYAITSGGRKIDNPRHLRKAERRLRRAQKALSRKEKGSKNRAKARVRVARLHAGVADTRKDFLHKLSTELVRDNQAVYVEDLCVKGLARTRMAKSVHDAAWGMFLAMLEEKTARYGRTFARVDRFFASSQICSACGFKDGKKPLNVREWSCRECGTRHDRDINAARNVLAEGRRVAAGRAETLNACGGTVSPGSRPAGPGETGTHRSAA